MEPYRVEKERSIIMKTIYLIVSLGALFILNIALFYNSAEASSSSDADNAPPIIVNKESKTETFKLRNGENILIEIYTEFKLDDLGEGERRYRYISANSCASAETYKLINNMELKDIENALNEKHENLINNTKACMKNLFNAEVSNLIIEYKRIEYKK